MQVWPRMRDGYVYAAEMSGMPVEEVPGGGHEARMRCAGEPVCYKKEREESPERKGQITSEHNDSRRSHATNHAMRSTAPGGSKDCKSFLFN